MCVWVCHLHANHLRASQHRIVYRPSSEEGWASSFVWGTSANSGHGNDLVRGICACKGHSDLRVRGRLEQAVADKSKVDSLLPSLPIFFLLSFLSWGSSLTYTLLVSLLLSAFPWPFTCEFQRMEPLSHELPCSQKPVFSRGCN